MQVKNCSYTENQHSGAFSKQHCTKIPIVPYCPRYNQSLSVSTQHSGLIYHLSHPNFLFFFIYLHPPRLNSTHSLEPSLSFSSQQYPISFLCRLVALLHVLVCKFCHISYPYFSLDKIFSRARTISCILWTLLNTQPVLIHTRNSTKVWETISRLYIWFSPTTLNSKFAASHFCIVLRFFERDTRRRDRKK